MIDPAVLENLLRGVAIGGFATTGAVLGLAPSRAPARWIGATFFLCAIGHVADNDAALRGAGDHAGILFWLLSALGPPMFWAFTVTLFRDDVKFPWPRLIPGAVALALSLLAGLAPSPRVFAIAYIALSVALVAHAFFVIARGWQDDLVEQRRRLRAPVLLAGALYVLIIAAGDLGHDLNLPFQTTPLFQALILAVLSLAAALTLLRVDDVLLGPPVVTLPQSPQLRATQTPDPAEEAMLERLKRALGEEKLWRRESLTIGALAAHLGVPEHRLRRLINGALGYRNFTALVNEHRIAAAKAELADPARKPVSTIAFDLGFGSLGPFNRAFKQATGVTPTVWRQRASRAES